MMQRISMLSTKFLLSAGSMCVAGVIQAAVVFPQLVISTTPGGSGVIADYDYTAETLSMDAIATDVELSGGSFINIIDEVFTLNVDLSTITGNIGGTSTYAGNLSVGSMLTATFEDFRFMPGGAQAPSANFDANLTYTGGDLMGEYTMGRIEGAFDNGGPDIDFTESFTASNIQARIGAVDAGSIPGVPVPPALLLFGSGLLGLIGISRHKKAA